MDGQRLIINRSRVHISSPACLYLFERKSKGKNGSGNVTIRILVFFLKVSATSQMEALVYLRPCGPPLRQKRSTLFLNGLKG
jgi:hypothetical protein